MLGGMVVVGALGKSLEHEVEPSGVFVAIEVGVDVRTRPEPLVILFPHPEAAVTGILEVKPALIGVMKPLGLGGEEGAEPSSDEPSPPEDAGPVPPPGAEEGDAPPPGAEEGDAPPPGAEEGDE